MHAYILQLFLMIFTLKWSVICIQNWIFQLYGIEMILYNFAIVGEDNGSESAQTMDIENSQTNGANNFPSLSSEEGGYLMGTPPTMSLDSEIQPCAVDMDLQQSGPSSLTNMSTDLKSVSSSISSDYKCITESKSMERQGTNSLLRTADILCADSSTDDQMSSGTFSHDEISPRYADLPEALNVEKRRTQSTSDAPRKNSDVYQHIRRRSSVKDRTLSMETRSTSIASDASEQEIPSTTPRSDPAVSPGSDFIDEYDNNNSEKPSTTAVMAPNDDHDSEMSSESHLSTTQTTQQTISSSEDSKVTTMVTEESSVYESVIKLSENVTENVLEETKTITKSTKLALEESIVLQKEDSDESEEKMLKSKDSDQKKQSVTVFSTESSVMVTKTDTRTYSDVLKSDKFSDTKQTVTTSSAAADKKSSLGKEAVSEVLKVGGVMQMVGSSSASHSGSEEKSKKLSYSEVVKADSNKDGKEKDDPIADWGKPLGLPSPIRPSTPAKQTKKNDEDSMDSNKVLKGKYNSQHII